MAKRTKAKSIHTGEPLLKELGPAVTVGDLIRLLGKYPPKLALTMNGDGLYLAPSNVGSETEHLMIEEEPWW